MVVLQTLTHSVCCVRRQTSRSTISSKRACMMWSRSAGLSNVLTVTGFYHGKTFYVHFTFLKEYSLFMISEDRGFSRMGHIFLTEIDMGKVNNCSIIFQGRVRKYYSNLTISYAILVWFMTSFVYQHICVEAGGGRWKRGCQKIGSGEGVYSTNISLLPLCPPPLPINNEQSFMFLTVRESAILYYFRNM